MSLSHLFVLAASLAGASAVAIGSGASPGGCVSCQAPPPPCNTCGSAGQWGQWGPWGPCTYQYGAYSQTRQRVCSGGSCPGGDSEEARQCSPPQQDQPAPQWNSWGAWSACSASCGGGTMTRQRTCNTQCGVCSCQGSGTETTYCNTQSCCSWGGWAPWSECSVTCGSGGYRTRNRICSCLACPEGTPSETESCSGAYSCPTVCNTCQYNPPVIPPPCTTCGYNPPIISPPPCTTCGVPVISPPSCSTCGVPQGLPSVYSPGAGGGTYYDPYSNGGGRRRRQLGSYKTLRETLMGNSTATTQN